MEEIQIQTNQQQHIVINSALDDHRRAHGDGESGILHVSHDYEKKKTRDKRYIREADQTKTQTRRSYEESTRERMDE